MIKLILFFIGFAVLEAWRDSAVIFTGQINHVINFWERIYIGLAVVLFLCFKPLRCTWMKELLLYLLACIAPFWITFDIADNLFLGRGVFACGHTAFFDRFCGWSLFAIKPIFLFFTIIICIEYFKNKSYE